MHVWLGLCLELGSDPDSQSLVLVKNGGTMVWPHQVFVGIRRYLSGCFLFQDWWWIVMVIEILKTRPYAALRWEHRRGSRKRVPLEDNNKKKKKTSVGLELRNRSTTWTGFFYVYIYLIRLTRLPKVTVYRVYGSPEQLRVKAFAQTGSLVFLRFKPTTFHDPVTQYLNH